MSPRLQARSKFSIVTLVTDHYATLRNYHTGRVVLSDYLLYLGLPCAGVLLGWYVDVKARNIPDVLAAAAILTGLIFNVFVLLFDLSNRAAEKEEFGRRQEIIELAEQLRANVSYAVLLGIGLTALLGIAVMFSDTTKPLPLIPSLAVIFIGIQLLLTIFMILKRVRALFVAFRLAQPERLP